MHLSGYSRAQHCRTLFHTLAPGSFLLKARQKKGEWIFLAFCTSQGIAQRLCIEKRLAAPYYVQWQARDKFTLEKNLSMTDNSKATNYRNFMPPAASGVKHSFQPCFYLLNLDKFIMLLMTVRKTLKCRNCIPWHKHNWSTIFYMYYRGWKIWLSLNTYI